MAADDYPRASGWLAPLAGAVAAAHAATLLLAPRRGLITPQPVRVADHFSAAEIRRARRYGRPQLALHAAGMAIDLGILAILIRRRRREPPDQLPPRHPVAEAVLGGAALTVGMTAAGLPLGAVARKRALNAGLATQPWRGWASDLAKSTAINAGLSGAGAGLAVGLMRADPQRWWVTGAAGSVAVTTAFTLAGPVLLDPIFNRFTPLAPGQTRDDVLELARVAGVRIHGAYEMDASRRTTAANAYVNGIGPTRRVVLFDTLLRTFTRDEARLVVAHELAHVRHRDVARSLAHLALVAPPSLRAVAGLTARLDGARQPSAATLPALALSLGVVSAAVSVAGHSLSRQIERRADAFALRLTGAPDAFVSFERRIVIQNLGDPAPPRWLTVLLGSHPPTVERIGLALAYAAKAGDATAGRPPGWLRRRRRTPAGS